MIGKLLELFCYFCCKLCKTYKARLKQKITLCFEKRLLYNEFQLKLLSNRNQPIYTQNKSTDYFFYDTNFYKNEFAKRYLLFK